MRVDKLKPLRQKSSSAFSTCSSRICPTIFWVRFTKSVFHHMSQRYWDISIIPWRHPAHLWPVLPLNWRVIFSKLSKWYWLRWRVSRSIVCFCVLDQHLLVPPFFLSILHVIPLKILAFLARDSAIEDGSVLGRQMWAWILTQVHIDWGHLAI